MKDPLKNDLLQPFQPFGVVTKIAMLCAKQVVDRLHSYVQNGDTVVDFCCGSNDFSRFMKQKLENSGKNCSFRNFDIIQTKNDFAFERRDWMNVGLEELPDGSQLIIGLHPPFGVKASLANMFIDKALEFRPKLLVLIVPEETMGLDRKPAPYNLVWEDRELLSGELDMNGNQLDQWYMRPPPPPLYLWSRPDWTARHLAIAQQCHHVIKKESLHTGKTEIKSENPNYLMDNKEDCNRDERSFKVEDKEDCNRDEGSFKVEDKEDCNRDEGSFKVEDKEDCNRDEGSFKVEDKEDCNRDEGSFKVEDKEDCNRDERGFKVEDKEDCNKDERSFKVDNQSEDDTEQ